MRADISEGLRTSGLFEAEAAADAALVPGGIEALGDSVITPALVKVYETRTKALAARPDAYFQRLSTSAGELARNLVVHLASGIEWLKVPGVRGTAFLCVRVAETGTFLGCMFVREAEGPSSAVV
ncbi:hypothetical protein ASC78_23695 [Variovorax sp. Root318D1]|nr:hypothetical protein ASC78_23695 [Variovorax sp. Root318D1]